MEFHYKINIREKIIFINSRKNAKTHSKTALHHKRVSFTYV